MASTTTFREAAIAHQLCRPEEFEKFVFRRCLYGHAKVAAWLLPRRLFEEDWHLIRESASACSVQAIVQNVNQARNVVPDEESLKDLFKLRVSGRKLIRLAETVLA